MTAVPNSIGHQDLAALIARQPAVSERWRAHVRNSTFGTIHAASLSFPRLAGASIPDPYFTQLASLDPRALEATGSIPLKIQSDAVVAAPVYDFPVVDRRLKGDRLYVSAPPPAQPELSDPKRPAKTKDMASRPPISGPAAGEPPLDQQQNEMRQVEMRQVEMLQVERRQDEKQQDEFVSMPSAPKGDRLAVPLMKSTAASERVYRRFGIAAGQDTQARRVLGTAPRMSVEHGLSATLADRVLRRFGIAAGEATLAKRTLGTAPRRAMEAAAPSGAKASLVHRLAARKTLAKRVLGVGPHTSSTLAARPHESAPVVAVTGEAQRAAPAKAAGPARRAGLAAAHLKHSVREARRLAAVAAREAAGRDVMQSNAAVPDRPQSVAVVALPDVAGTPGAAAPSHARPTREAIVTEAAAPVAPAPVIAEIVPPAPDKAADRFPDGEFDAFASHAKPAAQTRVFFGTHELGVGHSNWEAWEPAEVPTVLAPPHVDTEIKRAALDPLSSETAETGGETIAAKGEVTGEGKRPRTPAERLNLTGASRVKHARCLANAIYFEARGEVERGQMAVAQVILNRVFTGYYPGTICDVVYQNAHRHLACQFTFACDNHKDVVRDQKAWEVATRVSDEALDGKFWLPEVGKATHYHATYVNPWWVRTMTKHARLGVHVFYRPKRWGDGEEIPVWGDRLDVTGSIKHEMSSATADKGSDAKRADPQAASPRRSIFDPVEPIASGG